MTDIRGGETRTLDSSEPRGILRPMTRTPKIPWEGRIVAVGPRIRLTRSFDQRTHSYLGYVLRIEGTIGGASRGFTIAVGRGAHAKHAFRAGDRVKGESLPVEDPRKETAAFYRTSAIRVLDRGGEEPPPPPFLGVPPELPVYRARGHRRLAGESYEGACARCLWACEMPTEMIIDPWNPSRRQYRFETFCYGPKSCSLYRPGPARVVPGRKGTEWVEEDWVDEEATRHRGPDE